MAGLYQFGKVAEKQREQQHLDVRAVHVRVAQNAHFAVAQAAHVRRVVGAVRVYANGHRDVVDFGVGKQAVSVHLPGVEHLAAQGQYGLAFFVAAHFGAAPGRIALHQKHLVVGQVAAFAVGQLARQHRHARAFALFHLLAGPLAGLGGLDGQLGQLFAVVHVLVEPQLQRGANKTRHQAHRVPRIEPLLDLALELRVQHLGREHVAGAGKHVLGHELHALGQQAVQINKAFHCGEQAVAQAAFVRAPGAGGNQVDVALAQAGAVFGKGHAPLRALAFGKTVVLGIGKAFAAKQGNHWLARQRLHQVVTQAALVEPGLGVFGFFVPQRHGYAGHEHGLAAQQVGQLGHGQRSRLKIFGVGPDAHRGAALAVAVRRLAHLQGLGHVAALKHDARHRAFAVAGGLQALAQRVGDAHAHAVQAA